VLILSILLALLDSILFYFIKIDLNIKISTSLFKYFYLFIIYRNNLYLRFVNIIKCLVK